MWIWKKAMLRLTISLDEAPGYGLCNTAYPSILILDPSHETVLLSLFVSQG